MFLAPVIVYPVLALLLPAVFYIVNRRYIWLGIPIAAAIDLILYWREFSYYEARPIIILFTVAQIALMAVIILILTKLVSKRK